jgi:hypothetical protein
MLSREETVRVKGNLDHIITAESNNSRSEGSLIFISIFGFGYTNIS